MPPIHEAAALAGALGDAGQRDAELAEGTTPLRSGGRYGDVQRLARELGR